MAAADCIAAFCGHLGRCRKVAARRGVRHRDQRRSPDPYRRRAAILRSCPLDAGWPLEGKRLAMVRPIAVPMQTSVSARPRVSPPIGEQQGPPASADACIHNRAIGAGVVRLGAERPGAVGSSPVDTCARAARPTRHRRVSNARSTTCRSGRGRRFAPRATTRQTGTRLSLSLTRLPRFCKQKRLPPLSLSTGGIDPG